MACVALVPIFASAPPAGAPSLPRFAQHRPAKSWRDDVLDRVENGGTCGQEEHFIGIAIELAQGEAAATGQPTLSSCRNEVAVFAYS